MEEDEKKKLHVWLDNVIQEYERYVEIENQEEELIENSGSWDEIMEEWKEMRVEKLLFAQNMTMLLEGITGDFYEAIREIYSEEYWSQCKNDMGPELETDSDEYYVSDALFPPIFVSVQVLYLLRRGFRLEVPGEKLIDLALFMAVHQCFQRFRHISLRVYIVELGCLNE